MPMKKHVPGGFADKPGKFGDPHGAVVGDGRVMGPVRSPAGYIGMDYGAQYNKQSLHGMHSGSHGMSYGGRASSKTGY